MTNSEKILHGMIHILKYTTFSLTKHLVLQSLLIFRKFAILSAIFHVINEKISTLYVKNWKLCQPYPLIQVSSSIRDLRVLVYSCSKKLDYDCPLHSCSDSSLQLNQYETASYFIQFSQNLTCDCLMIFEFCPEFTWAEPKIVLFWCSKQF